MRAWLILLLLIGSCAYAQKKDNGSLEKLVILKIEESSLEHVYMIHVRFSATENNGVLVSKAELTSCEKELIVGETYCFSVKPLATTEGLTDITYRLGTDNIYVDGQLVFQKDTQFYKTSNLIGICVIDE